MKHIQHKKQDRFWNFEEVSVFSNSFICVDPIAFAVLLNKSKYKYQKRKIEKREIIIKCRKKKNKNHKIKKKKRKKRNPMQLSNNSKFFKKD